MAIESVKSRVERQLPRLYAPLSYHGLPHAYEVWNIANEVIAPRVEAAGVAVNYEELWLMCMLHDANFNFPPELLWVKQKGVFRPCQTREQVTVYTAAPILDAAGVDAQSSKRVLHGIAGTNPRVTPRTVEARILAAADLYRVAGLYSDFAENWAALCKERLEMGLEPKSDRDLVAPMLGYLALFTARRIRLTESYFAPNGASCFHAAAVVNILRLTQELWQQSYVVGELEAGSFASGLGEVNLQRQGVVYVALSSGNVDHRHALLGSVKQIVGEDKPLPLALALPQESGAFSLPTKCLNEARVTNGWNRLVHNPRVNDLHRVMKSGGKLRVLENTSERPVEVEKVIARLERGGFQYGAVTRMGKAWSLTMVA